MLRYPTVVPGAHPAATSVFEHAVYVEALLPGPTVGFALINKQLWIDMPYALANVVPTESRLNPDYHYVGRLLTDPDRIVLTDVLTATGPLDHEAKFIEADRVGMECVQLLHAGELTDPQQIQDFLLQSPTGIVCKPITVSQQRRLVYAEITPAMFGPQLTAEGQDANVPAAV